MLNHHYQVSNSFSTVSSVFDYRKSTEFCNISYLCQRLNILNNANRSLKSVSCSMFVMCALSVAVTHCCFLNTLVCLSRKNLSYTVLLCKNTTPSFLVHWVFTAWGFLNCLYMIGSTIPSAGATVEPGYHGS